MKHVIAIKKKENEQTTLRYYLQRWGKWRERDDFKSKSLRPFSWAVYKCSSLNRTKRQIISPKIDTKPAAIKFE